MQVINFAALEGEDGETEEDVLGELTLLRKRQHEEDERLRRLVHGRGTGRPKSAEFELAARTILATGCSARAAKDQILVAAGLVLPVDKFEAFEREVPLERWFRAQRKGLGYEAWVYAMLRVAKCEEILQYGFDETKCEEILGPNILRDSILTRLENLHYEAYVHCCACMWKCLFKELRGLTNTTNMLNPLELNDLYDHMWNVGVLLQSDEPLAILADDFRP